jgi:hypothetical protein
VCYFLLLATPLTLSEVRSMLPAGLAAHPVGSTDASAIRRLLPGAQTVATLVVGGCSCDLVRTRDPDPRTDERHLRARYFGLGLTRERIILELERHRRGRGPSERSGDWPRALRAFVAEHARNAGPTLYLLRFEPGDARTAGVTPAITRTVPEMESLAGAWLPEGQPVLIVR